MGVLIAVTDHAAERFRQRVRGTLEAKEAVTERVARAWADGSIETSPPPGAAGGRGSLYLRDPDRPSLLYVCRHDRPRGELVVITLWDEGEDAAVPRRFTDELKRLERRPRLRRDDATD
jgi:hypothetical protein